MEKKEFVKRSVGRPLDSAVRLRIRELLLKHGPSYGYQIYKQYMDKYPAVTLRLIYYHLRKGLSTGEFKILKVEQKEGTYSWGTTTNQIIYAVADKK